MINDLYADWNGHDLFAGGSRLEDRTRKKPSRAEVPALGSRTVQFRPTVPIEAGKYRWVAELTGTNKSWCKACATLPPCRPPSGGKKIARGKPASSSSNVTGGDAAYSAAAAVDGNVWTRWLSAASDPQWLAVDLGQPEQVCSVDLIWGWPARSYSIQISADGRTWKDAYATEAEPRGARTIRFSPVEARWVRMLGKKRVNPATGYARVSELHKVIR